MVIPRMLQNWISALKTNFITQFVASNCFHSAFIKNYGSHYCFTLSYESISKNKDHWKNNTKEYKEENKIYNLYNTDHFFRLWWTESTFSPISRANVAHAGFRAVARQQTLQWEPPKPEGFPITVLHNSANSSMRMHSVAFEHKKDPDSYLIHVCYIITIVPDCNILHVRIYFELSMKKYNILKKHLLQSLLVSLDRVSHHALQHMG